jgi:hypothetical protein
MHACMRKGCGSYSSLVTASNPSTLSTATPFNHNINNPTCHPGPNTHSLSLPLSLFRGDTYMQQPTRGRLSNGETFLANYLRGLAVTVDFSNMFLLRVRANGRIEKLDIKVRFGIPPSSLPLHTCKSPESPISYTLLYPIPYYLLITLTY